MPYPTLRPTARDFDPGDYPIKSLRAQSGAEVRILYGSQRTGMTLDLNYENVSDTDAAQFVTHYDEVKGTYTTFTLPSAVRTGWGGASTAIDAVGSNRWRYESAPAITNVRPGLSSVRVKLKGVL